jgi:hypothetical protein
MAETAADKQKRLIQQEIAKLSGMLEFPLCRVSKADQQAQFLDMEDHPVQPPTPHLREITHTQHEVHLEEEVSHAEEEEVVHTHWIYDKASLQ